MNKRKPVFGKKPRPPMGRSGSATHTGPSKKTKPASERADELPFRIIERASQEAAKGKFTGPFRVLIAVHRPRFRGRAERAAALVGWEVLSLLNKQDPVGQCQKAPRPPDLLILSGDFGRQKDYAIFRAVQRFREQGMKLVGMVEDCETAPEEFPDSVPSQLCDVCLVPPYKTADLRVLFSELYTQMRGKPAPPPITKAETEEDEEE